MAQCWSLNLETCVCDDHKFRVVTFVGTPCHYDETFGDDPTQMGSVPFKEVWCNSGSKNRLGAPWVKLTFI